MKANKRVRDLRRIRTGCRKVVICRDGARRNTTAQVHKDAPRVKEVR